MFSPFLTSQISISFTTTSYQLSTLFRLLTTLPAMRSTIFLLASTLMNGMSGASESGRFYRRMHNPERDIHLGSLRSLDDFFERLGTNSSDWEVVLQETPLGPEESPFGSHSSRGVSSRQDDKCGDKTGIEYYVCEALPHRAFVWVAGALVIVYYAPRIMDSYLDNLARLIHGGINLAGRYERIQGGHEGEVVKKLKVRHLDTAGLDLESLGLLTRDSEFEPELVHFDVEHDLLKMNKRDLDAEAESGVSYQANAYSRYALDTATGELQYRGTDASLSVDSSAARALRRGAPSSNDTITVASGQNKAAETYNDWSLVITADRESTYYPTSDPGCIKQYLYDRVLSSDDVGRHSCMHMAERSTPLNYYSMIGTFINPGGNNFELKWGDCCVS